MTTKTKADENGPFKEFDFEEWLKDGLEGFRQKVESEVKGFDLSDFCRHLRNAKKEQLLAMRSLIDKAIERLEQEEERRKA